MDTQTEETQTEEVLTEEATSEVQVAETPETPTPVERPQGTSRQDRKRARIDVEAAQRERDEIKQRLEREASERTRLDRELAELRGRLEERQTQTQQVDKHAETKTKIGDLRRQAKFHLFLSAKATDQATADKEWDEHKRLEDEANDLRDDMRDEARWEKRRGEISAQMPNEAAQAEKVFLSTKFPWLETSVEAQALSDGRFRTLVAAGSPATRETAVAAIAWAGQKLGLGGQQAPSPTQRALYSGMPSGEGPGGGDSRKTVKMGRHEEAMARAAYPHLEAKDAYKQWANDVTARMNSDE